MTYMQKIADDTNFIMQQLSGFFGKIDPEIEHQLRWIVADKLNDCQVFGYNLAMEGTLNEEG